jgi:adenosylcobinamide-GDP ribazoletransferase
MIVRRALAPLAASVAFLTRLPMPRALLEEQGAFARAAMWFPVVGAIVGGIEAGVFVAAARLWSTTVAVVLAVGAVVIATGALHEDALADAADGFGGGKTRERVLEIMKDSRVGSFGVVALLLVMAAKLATLDAIARDGAASFTRAVIVAHVLARWSALPLLAALPYVRGITGIGNSFADDGRMSRAVIGTVMSITLTTLIAPSAAFLCVIAASFVTISCGVYFRRRIEGVTGDCLGSVNQIVELLCYLIIAAR